MSQRLMGAMVPLPGVPHAGGPLQVVVRRGQVTDAHARETGARAGSGSRGQLSDAVTVK
jgi:hypothetical protein